MHSVLVVVTTPRSSDTFSFKTSGVTGTWLPLPASKAPARAERNPTLAKRLFRIKRKHDYAFQHSRQTDMITAREPKPNGPFELSARRNVCGSKLKPLGVTEGNEGKQGGPLENRYADEQRIRVSYPALDLHFCNRPGHWPRIRFETQHASVK